ncbi:hypothetical protein AUJ77_01035 [Candidatus Nomurabacteria bacterium CG1_02_43_90]|uniref:Uncharacterized protein n=1 Tax=Candidatus Nomurabacteria bacterium CG1_02_43_90 TaxID=1805281 RepID=A0A1J4V9G6_9BACT|nr:MAG: hypothetical protein AUJ77_01035 [Candidatus Nomurabacteria bacterium CG1_02_43_90]
MEFTKQSHPDIKVCKPEEKLGTLGEQLKAKGQDIRLINSTVGTPVKKQGGNKKSANFQKRAATYGEVVAQTIKNIDGIRKGTPGNPTAINEAVKRARESVSPAKQNLDAIKNKKGELLLLLADLRAQQRQVEQGDFSETTREHIRGSIVDAQRKLGEINSAIPNTDPLEDNRHIQRILDEWEKKKQEETLLEEPERVSPGIFGHTKENEEMQKEMDTLNEQPNSKAQNNMNIEQPLPEEKDHKVEVGHLISGEELGEAIQARILELEGKADEDSVREKERLEKELAELHKNISEGAEKIKVEQPNRVEERAQEVVARQAELEGKDDTASKEERAELEKEYASIQKRRQEIKKVNPLQSPYDIAMERLNKENDVQRNKDWKLKEINNTEELPRKEGDDELKDILITQENTTTVLEENISLKEEAVLGLSERADKTREQMRESLAQMGKRVEVRAEKVGATETIFAIGRAYQKWPLKHKLLISGVLFLTASSLAVIGGAAGSAIATAAFTGSAIQRILGGFAMAATAEGLLTVSAERNGRIREEGERNRHTAEALILGVLVGGGVMGHALQNVFHEFFPVHEVSIPKGQAGILSTGEASSLQTDLNKEIALGKENLDVINHSYLTDVRGGDSMWKIAEHQLQQNLHDFNELPEGQRVHLIDAIKDKIAENPQHFGITSGNADVLAVGDHLDFKDIFSNQQFMGETIDKAHHLTPGEITGIENYSAPKSAPLAEVTQHSTVPSVAHTETATPTHEVVSGPSDHIKEVAQRISSGGTENAEGLRIGREMGDAIQEQNPARILALENQLGLTHQEFIQMLSETNKLGEVSFDNEFIHQVDKLGGTAINSVNTISVPFERVVVPNSQILEQASQQVHGHINNLFGTNGFFGFGAVDGMSTPNWKDAAHGFANKTVTEIVQMEPEKMQKVAGSIGTENKDAVIAIRKYIDETFINSRVQPLEGETLENYFKRATAMAINSKTK